MIQIKNRIQLIQNGQKPQLQKARAIAIHSLECAINAANPKQLIHSKIKLDPPYIQAEHCKYNLKNLGNIYVLGGGKAGAEMAKAIEEILGRHITSGLVNVPYNTKTETNRIKLNEASHPVPDQAGVIGTRHMIKIAEKATADDLIIFLTSGGGSSLMPLPQKGITLKDKQETTKALLKSGTKIQEINVVRKHLSAFKGGWLAKKAYPAKMLNLILSDVVGDPLDSIASGPTVPDPSTFNDAKSILEKYCLWSTTPSSIKNLFLKGIEGLLPETPKEDEPTFGNVCNIIIGNNKIASRAAVECLKSEGIKTIDLNYPLEGEAKAAGKKLATVANQITAHDSSFPKPISMVAGGETIVTVKGDGVGGRNQELVLSASLNLKAAATCVIASISTDGIDGPTDAAGAIIDGYTLKRAKTFGTSPEEYLKENNSYSFFSKIGDLIFTGATGTNVNDITVIVVL